MNIEQLLNYQTMPWDELATLKLLAPKEPGEWIWPMSCAYLYGLIMGKREERARRRKNNVERGY